MKSIDLKRHRDWPLAYDVARGSVAWSGVSSAHPLNWISTQDITGLGSLRESTAVYIMS